jgi:hypothetical protein
MLPYNNSHLRERKDEPFYRKPKNNSELVVESFAGKKDAVNKFIEYLKTDNSNKIEQANIKSSKTIDEYIDKTINAMLTQARAHDREDEYINSLYIERSKILKAFEAEKRKLEASQLTMEG